MKNKNTIDIIEIDSIKYIKKVHRTEFFYHREKAVLSLLMGSKLSYPQIIESLNGTLILSYLDGRRVIDVLEELEKSGDINKGIELVMKVCKWLLDFYNYIYSKLGKKIIKGDVNLKNFILSEDGIVYAIDFEDCASGDYADEIGELIAFILSYNPSYTPYKKMIKDAIIIYVSNELSISVDDIENKILYSELEMKYRRIVKKSDISIAILSGGKSNRMHGVNKGTLPLGNAKFIDRLIGEFYWADNIMLSVAQEFDGVLNYDIVLVADLYKDAGPLGGILSVLKVSKTKYTFFTPCDTPLITTKTSQMLLCMAMEGDFDAVVAVDEVGRYNPLCAVYSKGLIDRIEKLIKDGIFKVTELYNDINIMTVYINTEELININTPEDYIKFTQKHRELFI